MGVRLLDESCRFTLVAYLVDKGWHLQDFDAGSESLILLTTRNGRTDDEIEYSARVARVAIAVTISLYMGRPACPSFRYKVIEDEVTC